jgi:1,2-diacylglycerol-3-alpha-glucose alpha-1,2-glucosyltransferase
MKICLYLEFYHALGGAFFKKIGTGLLSSYRNQKVMLEKLGIPYTEKWDPTCDILQINTPWLWSLVLIRQAKKRGMKVIIWSHVTMEDAMQVFRFTPYIAPLFKKYITYAYGQADIIFSPTEYTKKLLVAYGLPAEKIIVRSNAVDTHKFYSSLEKRNAGRKFYGIEKITIGTVGLVIPRKGVDTFLKLAEKFPINTFIWYGKMYGSLFVKPLPKELPLNAIFSGYVPDILEAFNSIDVFVFPSYEENQGMVILEAAAVGLPIIVRDIPVYEGWLVHGENCLKAKTDEEFETCVRSLIENKELRAKLSASALELAKKESIETQSVQTLEVYKKLQGKEGVV